MEIFATIMTGVVVFVLGQIVQQFVLLPIQNFNRERGNTSYLLLRYQAAITNASGRNPKAIDEIHKMGAALISTITQIPFYGFLSSIRMLNLPLRQAVREAAQEVNGIVHRMQTGGDAFENVKALQRIAELLGIRTTF